jgi:hypothetical protein
MQGLDLDAGHRSLHGEGDALSTPSLEGVQMPPADFVLLPGFLSAIPPFPVQTFLDECVLEATTEPGRSMICACPTAASSPLFDAVHRVLIPHGLYVEDVWGQCLDGRGSQHSHFDQLKPHVVGRLVLRLGAPGELLLALSLEDSSEYRRAGATLSWERQVPVKVAANPESRVSLFHGDAYFIGRVASGADPLVAAGGTGRVAHEVPSTPGNSASVVFQVARTPGTAFDVKAFADELRLLKFPNILVSQELDFAGLHPISDTEWQLDQRRKHLKWRQIMMDFASSSVKTSDDAPRDCKFEETLRCLQASYLRAAQTISTPPPAHPLTNANASTANPRKCPRHLLILDLNGMLLDRGDFWSRKTDNVPCLRPFAIEFIVFVQALFEVAVWTCAPAGAVVNDEIKALFGGRRPPLFVYTQERSTKVDGGESILSPQKPLFLKELSAVWTSAEGGMFDENNTLLVENLLERFQKNPLGTGMLIPTWSKGDDDCALRPSGDLCRLLMRLSKSPNVAEFVLTTRSPYLPRVYLPPSMSLDRLSDWKRSDEQETLKTSLSSSIEKAGVTIADWIQHTVLCGEDFVVVRQMFPYTLPQNVTHWMLWGSTKDAISSQRMELIVADCVARLSTQSTSVVKSWAKITESNEQAQSVPQLYHAHLFFETSGEELPLSSSEPEYAPQYLLGGATGASADTNITIAKIAFQPPLNFSPPSDAFATGEIASRHMKELFPSCLEVKVVSVIQDIGPRTILRVLLLEHDGSSRDVVVKFLLDEQSDCDVNKRLRLASEPMRANRAYACLPESVPRLIAGPTNPELLGQRHVQAFAMDYVDSTTFAEEFRSCNDVVPSSRLCKALRDMFFPSGLLTRLANFAARAEPEKDPLQDIGAKLRRHALRCKKEDEEASSTISKVDKLIQDRYFPVRLVHGDLHGGNILLADDGEVKLVDFSRSMRLPQLYDAALLIVRILFDYVVVESDEQLAEAITLTRSLFAPPSGSIGNLHDLPSVNLRVFKSPNILRASHSVLQIWQYLGPFVSSCGGGNTGLHLNNLFVPVFEVVAGISAVVDMNDRGKTLRRETMRTLASSIQTLSSSSSEPAIIKRAGSGKSRLRDIVKQKICMPYRVNRNLLERLAGAQQTARNDTLHSGAKVSFGKGQRLRLLMETGTGFKRGTVVEFDPESGKHLFAWDAPPPAAGSKQSEEESEEEKERETLVDLESVLWFPETAGIQSIHDSYKAWVEDRPRVSQEPEDSYAVQYRVVRNACAAARKPSGKYWILNADAWEQNCSFLGSDALMKNVPKVPIAKWDGRADQKNEHLANVEVKSMVDETLFKGVLGYYESHGNTDNRCGKFIFFPDAKAGVLKSFPDCLDGNLTLHATGVAGSDAVVAGPIVVSPRKTFFYWGLFERITLLENPDEGWYSRRQHGTVVAHCEEGYVWRGDNSAATRVIGVAVILQSRAWSTGEYFHYFAGQTVSILDGAAWKDSTVVRHKNGNCHELRLSTSEVVESFDLNEDNHCVAHLGSVRLYEAYSDDYRKALLSKHSQLQDAITGTYLNTVDQLIYVSIKHKTDSFWTGTSTVADIAERMIDPTMNPRPAVIIASAGTGKTWMMTQLVYLIASASQKSSKSDQFIPLLLPVQDISKLLLQNSTACAIHFVEYFIRHKYSKSQPRWCQVLLQAFRMKKLILVIDGMDEAAGQTELIENFIFNELVCHRHRFVVTSRPEGVKDERVYEKSFFVVLNLNPLTVEDQDRIIDQQLKGNEFFSNLQAFSNVRSVLDKVYQQNFTVVERSKVEGIPQLDLFCRADGTYDPRMRQPGPNKLPMKRLVDPRNPRSATLRRLVNLRNDSKFPVGLDEKLQKLRMSKECFWGLGEDELWDMIVADTDELLAAAESVKGEIESIFRKIGSDAGLEKDDIVIGPLKDPIRIFEKAKSDYDARFQDDVPSSANVVDVIRSRALCKTAAEMLKLVHAIECSGLLVARVKNKFDDLLMGPAHFRNILLNICLVDARGGVVHVFELQIHHRDIYSEAERLHSHTHYEYFRSRILATTVEQKVDFVLERRMRVFSEITKVPVLLSLLIVLLKNNLDRMPETMHELYEIAIDIHLSNARLTNRAGVEKLLTLIAARNHSNSDGTNLKPRRLFDTSTIKSILSSNPELISVWRELSTRNEIPLVKTIQRDCHDYGDTVEELDDNMSSESAGLYQFAHLSIQEFLFAKHLVASHPNALPLCIRKQFLENDLLRNALNIAASNTSFCRSFINGTRNSSADAWTLEDMFGRKEEPIRLPPPNRIYFKPTLSVLPRLCQILLGAPRDAAEDISLTLQDAPTSDNIDSISAVLEKRPDLVRELNMEKWQVKDSEGMNQAYARLQCAMRPLIEERKFRVFNGVDFSTFSPTSLETVWDFSHSTRSNLITIALLVERLPESTTSLSLVGNFNGTVEEVTRPLARLSKLERLSLHSAPFLNENGNEFAVVYNESSSSSSCLMTGPLPAFSSYIPSLRYVNLSNQVHLIKAFPEALRSEANGKCQKTIHFVPLSVVHEGIEVVICDSKRIAAGFDRGRGSDGPDKYGFWNEIGSLYGKTNPVDLGQLENLETLDLSGKNLVGWILLPKQLKQCKMLKILMLKQNELTGSIPVELGQLKMLKILELYHNELTGSIPVELGQLENLESLNLRYNKLTGNIPPELGQLKMLKDLYLYHNELTGSIPVELGQLENLETLNLESNKLTGNIPPELGQMKMLKVLFLRYNQLTGSIPVELGQLENLESLNLESNKLIGRVPDKVLNLAKLAGRNFSNNPGLSIPLDVEQLENSDWQEAFLWS